MSHAFVNIDCVVQLKQIGVSISSDSSSAYIEISSTYIPTVKTV